MYVSSPQLAAYDTRDAAGTELQGATATITELEVKLHGAMAKITELENALGEATRREAGMYSCRE